MKQWVKNREIFSLNPLRTDALALLEAGLSAIETEGVLRSELSWDANTRTLCVRDVNVCFTDFEHVYFIGIGKCAVQAGKVIEEMFGDTLTDGVVLDVQSGTFQKLRSFVGTHPFPSEQNVTATDEVVSLLRDVTERDLVITVISGGGSALLCNPFKTDCETLTKITTALMQKGAPIAEINTVRKHLSRVQGGQLARIAYPATVVGLIFSDVVGNDVSMVASGPLSKDTTTTADAFEILERYDIVKTCGIPGCDLTETPKEDRYFEKVKTILLANNARALEAMRKEADALGYNARIVTETYTGEARTLGEAFARDVTHGPLGKRTASLYGGESTVTIRNKTGIGGRNQELALGALGALDDNTLLLAFASDGKDNGDCAGAVADALSLARAREHNLNPETFLKDNNSTLFWKQVDGAVLTGKTGSNVADVVLVLHT